MTALRPPAQYASEIDAFAYGEYRNAAPSAAPNPVEQFTGRITLDGSSGYPAEVGRYHLYAGWSSTRSHQATITLAHHGLTDVVSVGYVDRLRDARGWAFRERTGADEVNGFTLLRDAYDVSAPGYAGDVSIPVLWDRQTNRIVSNDPLTIDIDLATAFAPWANPGIDTYPVKARAQIDELSREIAELDVAIASAIYHDIAKAELRARLRSFDERLARRRYLLGDHLTIADVRLWVILARYDAGPNANGAAGLKLPAYENLWSYARDLYALPAFRATTDFASFTAPLTALPTWTSASPVNRLTIGHEISA